MGEVTLEGIRAAAARIAGAVNSGHYLAEEAPEEVLGRLTAFFAA